MRRERHCLSAEHKKAPVDTWCFISHFAKLVRPARVADAPRIGVVGYAFWQRGIGVHVGLQAHARTSPETFASFARASHEQIAVAECKATITGFVATEHGDNHISDVWVHPDFEGAGIGTRLVSALEEIVDSRGYDSIEIEAFTTTRALRLYRYLGYRNIRMYIGGDMVLEDELHKIAIRKEIGQPSSRRSFHNHQQDHLSRLQTILTFRHLSELINSA